MARIPGITVTVGGRELEVPPLSFSAVKRFSIDGTFDKAETLGDQKTWGVSTLDAIARIALAALQRNYPDMNEAGLDTLLEAEPNWGEALGKLLLAVKGVTFTGKAKEEKQGEP